MKVLILYDISHQVVLMDSLCENINKIGIYADSFDASLLRFYSPQGGEKCFWVWLYKKAQRLPHGKGFIKRHFYLRLILQLSKNYDIIDVQSLFEQKYSFLIPKLKEMGKKVKVHIWGSDFYLDLPERVRWQVKVYESVDIIQIATNQMKMDFVKKFPEYKSKIRVGVFGNQHLDDLIDFKMHPERMDLSFIPVYYNGKIVVTCGYNARPRQQHLKMIQALNDLSQEQQDKLFVVFPMTYLRDDEYIRRVEGALSNVHFKYVMIKDYMTETQLMSLRMITDLYINIIESDALSSSTQEHLFCGNVVIVGDWLPYSIFEENGVFYIKSTLEQLSNNIKYAIAHIDELRIKSTFNPSLLYGITSWKSAISKFKNVYEEMLN